MWKRCAKSGLDLISGLGGVDERDGVDLGREAGLPLWMWLMSWGERSRHNDGLFIKPQDRCESKYSQH